ncbi:caspase family protein [bacterium]|nr:caspase family protein [bacterium]
MKKNLVALMLSSVAAASALVGCGVPGASMVNGETGSLKGMSAVTGTKRAFLVGINDYMMQGADLRGCVNDIKNVQANMLSAEGFKANDTTVLLDQQATRENILAGLKAAVAATKKGDFLYFHYSGHGAQVRDTNGDEPDGMDEILCPTDLASGPNGFKNAILDDELQSILGQLPAGASMLFVSDSCNSGTVDRLNRVRGLNLENNTRNLDAVRVNTKAMSTFAARANSGAYTLISGCQDDQTSADAYITGTYNGALTYYLVDSYKKGGQAMTYADWHKATVSAIKANRYSQTPNLQGAANAKIFSIVN